MGIKILKPASVLLIICLGLLFLVNKAVAYCPPYFAFVDKVASSYPKCLSVDGGMFCGGDLEVVNNCSNEVVLGDKKIPIGETEYGFKEVKWDNDSAEQKVQKWELKGDLNGKPFIVKGRTENWTDKGRLKQLITVIPFGIKGAILLLLIAIPIAIFIRKKRKG